MATPGGPLLTVGDMLRDLSEDSSSATLPTPPSPSPSPSTATQNPKSGLVEEGLSKSFEKTYKQLDAALKQSGHTWTGLTQELCATLTTADKLVASTHSNLGKLTHEINMLEEVVERGQTAILQLHSNLGRGTNLPESSR